MSAPRPQAWLVTQIVPREGATVSPRNPHQEAAMPQNFTDHEALVWATVYAAHWGGSRRPGGHRPGGSGQRGHHRCQHGGDTVPKQQFELIRPTPVQRNS